MHETTERFVLVNIGCIECEVSSNIVAVYENREDAERDAEILNTDDETKWREGGQNSYEVFPLPPVGVVGDEYRGTLARAKTTPRQRDTGQ